MSQGIASTAIGKMQIINDQVKLQWTYGGFYWPFFFKFWLSIYFKTCGQVLQTLVYWAFPVLRETQNVDREFVKFDQVF